MKNFLAFLFLLGLILYFRRQQQDEFFHVWTALNSLKLGGRRYAEFLED